MKDIFGKALLDYQNSISKGLKHSEHLLTWTNISDKDELPLPYLFRDYSEMPKIEQKALQLAKGKILDVGCGAGSHSLWLQEKGHDVTAIDTSKGAIEVAQERGVLNAEMRSLLEEDDTFDTILLLMNGSGIFQEMSHVLKYLQHLKSLLNSKGQILIDSSDISYMYADEDGGSWVDLNSGYQGELDYYICYKGETEQPLKWLYLDFETLKMACSSVSLSCKKVMDGDHFDYLAKITL